MVLVQFDDFGGVCDRKAEHRFDVIREQFDRRGAQARVVGERVPSRKGYEDRQEQDHRPAVSF